MNNMNYKKDFEKKLKEFVKTLEEYITTEDGTTKKINTLKDFVEYRKGDSSLIVAKNNKNLK